MVKLKEIIGRLKFIAQGNPNMTPEQQQKFQELKRRFETEFLPSFREFEKKTEQILKFCEENRPEFYKGDYLVLTFVWLPYKLFFPPRWVYKYLEARLIGADIWRIMDREMKDSKEKLITKFRWVKDVDFPKKTDKVVIYSNLRPFLEIPFFLGQFKRKLNDVQKLIKDLEKEDDTERIKEGLKDLYDETLTCAFTQKAIDDTLKEYEGIFNDFKNIKRFFVEVFERLEDKIASPEFWKERIERHYLRMGKTPPEIKEARLWKG